MSKSAYCAALGLLAASLGCGGGGDSGEPRRGVAAEAAGPAASKPADPRVAIREQAGVIFAQLPDEAVDPDNPITDEKIELGRILFYDPRFSKSQTISCNSCHDLASFGDDGEPTSLGHKGQRGVRNAPTVYNAAFHIAQFWDGRAADVEEQAKGPVLNPAEMGMPDENAVLEVLRSIPGYEPLFRAAFPGEADPITYENMARAIGAFERRLVTPGRFDAFLAGDVSALTRAEVEGLETFIKTGCPTCHTGALVGGSMYQKLGLIKPYPTDDPGRRAVTGREADRQVFKVPSLRNVAETAPYFHDGSVPSLDQAIRKMADYQLGRSPTDNQVLAIATFLRSLTGDIDPDYIAEPELPPSGPRTPPPDPS